MLQPVSARLRMTDMNAIIDEDDKYGGYGNDYHHLYESLL